jgi:hypothetical protein
MADRDETNHYDLTRRQWLLRLGHTVVLTGFSGVAGELAADALTAQEAAGSPGQALPPGLYLPNNDHLTHALMSDDPFHPVPPGSATDYIRPRTGPFVPQFFSADQFAVVRRLVELFLGNAEGPKSGAETKGAPIADEVAEWIDLIVFNAESVREAVRRLAPEHRVLADHYRGPEAMRELETADPQKAWRDGLEWLAEESQNRFGKSFLSLAESEQLDVLIATSDDRADKAAEDAGTRLFALLKTQTLDGFYTSRLGLTELDYKGNTYHAECPGCTGVGHP